MGKPYYRKFSFLDFWLMYKDGELPVIVDLDDIHDIVENYKEIT